MKESSTGDDSSYNDNSSYYNGSSSSTEDSSNSNDHGMHHRKVSVGNSGLDHHCPFKRKEKHAREQSLTPTHKHPKHCREHVCKQTCKSNSYHDLSNISDKNDSKSSLKAHYREQYRKKKWLCANSKLSRRVWNKVTSCGHCGYHSTKNWLLDNIVDESTRVYYHKRKKTSSSSKKKHHQPSFHYLNVCSDEETRKHPKTSHGGGCQKRRRTMSTSCMNASIGDKSMETMGDCSSIQDIERKEDKVDVSKEFKSAIGSNKKNDIKLDVHGCGIFSVTKEPSLTAGSLKNETPDLACSFESPLSQQSFLQHNSNKKESQMRYGLGRAQAMLKQQEFIILDQSDDECTKKGEPSSRICLKNHKIERKQEENNDACRRDQEIVDNEWSIKGMTFPEYCLANCNNNHSENGILLKDEDILPRVKVKTPDVEWSQSNKSTQSLTQNSTTIRDDVVREKETWAEETTLHSPSIVSQRRKKRMIDKNTLPFVVIKEKSKEPVIVVEKAVLSKMVEPKPHMWDIGMLCDLCRRGPSLLMGEWYSWCCGSRLHYCVCDSALKLKLMSGMSTRKNNKTKKNDEISWSGVVHKMCGLWSSEVYEEGEVLQGLYDAVKRGKTLTCSACREYGATLGCRVKACRRSFHYPCADELASKLLCRMWDGVQYPVTCRGHRHVPHSCANAKEKAPDLKKWRYRGLVPRKNMHYSSCDLKSEVFGCSTHCLQSGQRKKENQNVDHVTIDISSESEEICKKEISDSNTTHILSGSNGGMKVDLSTSKGNTLNQRKPETVGKDGPKGALYHMGTNLLCEDISGGCEAVLIPCTNDIDFDPAPTIKYITKNRYFGKAKRILESVLLDEINMAPACEGCDLASIDNPHANFSAHAGIKGSQSVSDTRFDWQGQPMFRRLPYDRFGRLLLGSVSKDIIECNSRCPCGVSCLNRELQKGIQTPLEVFKTKDRGWGVRTMEQIPRGKFVMEYVGEILTHCEAEERGWTYDQSNLSFLFNVDHPDVPPQDLLVIDGFHMSNVARFINHSCDGNLSVFRVYTDTMDLRFCRIGHYALRDIEIGEELCYDYGYTTCEKPKSHDFSTDPTAIKCLCGARNCRGWLWTGTKCG